MPVVPTWFRVHGGFALQSGIDRRTAVELWYADDIELTVANEAPNDTTLFGSLPPIGSPSSDPGLTGAIVIDHRIVEPAVKIGTTARAKVAVIYDSDVRFRLEPRLVSGTDPQDSVGFDVPFVKLRAIPGGTMVVRHDEKNQIMRPQRRRWVQVRVSGDDVVLADLIEEQCGKRYVFGATSFLLETYRIAPTGGGDYRITYYFRTKARVRAVTGDTFGEHTSLPALGNLDEYQVNHEAGTVGIRLGTSQYEAGATLPGGVG